MPFYGADLTYLRFWSLRLVGAAVAETLSENMARIKELEQRVRKDKKDLASIKKLVTEFEGLQKLKEGPLAYLDVTTTEDMIHLYKVDTESYFEELQRKEMGLTGATNPNNYIIIPTDIRLVVIERSTHNEEIAKSIINLILNALKKRIG